MRKRTKFSTAKNSIADEVAPQGIILNFNIYKNNPIAVNIKFIFSKYRAVFELKQYNVDSKEINFYNFENFINKL